MRSITCSSVVSARVDEATFAAARTARRLRGVKSTGTRIRRNIGLRALFRAAVTPDVAEGELFQLGTLQADDLRFSLRVREIPLIHEDATDHPQGGHAIGG